MNLQRIEQLIEKYERAETSTGEEKILKDFFLKEEIPLHLRSYSALFNFIDNSQKEELEDKNFDDRVLKAIGEDKVIPISSGKNRKIYTLAGIAASIIILIGLYFQFRNDNITIHDTYDDPQLAYAETKQILLRVSGNLNSGLDELKKISEFNNGLDELNNISAFETGIKSLEKISVLDKSKKIVTLKK